MTTTVDPWDVLEGPSTRTPRSVEKRGSTERKRVWKEPSLLPEPVPRDGWVFKWVRTSSRGVDDKVNVDKRIREGWEAVQAEEHPEILEEWHMPARSGNIESGGLLLCKMPQEMVDQRTAHLARKTRDNIDAAEENYMRDNDEIVKKISQNKSKRMYGFTAR